MFKHERTLAALMLSGMTFLSACGGGGGGSDGGGAAAAIGAASGTAPEVALAGDASAATVIEQQLQAYTVSCAAGQPSAANWAQGRQYAAGSIVSYGGKQYIATYANPGYNPTISTYYWSLYACTTPAPAPSPAQAPAQAPACNAANWVQGKQYAASSIVSYGGKQYIATYANPGYNPTISTYYWSLHTCATPAPTPSPAPAPAPAPAPSPVAGLGYPFASQLTPYVAGIKPSSASQATQDALIRKQYDYWKANIVRAGCGGYLVGFNSTYAMVSEGAGYGMLLTVLMAGHDSQAKTLFDGLLRVVRSHPATGTGYPALMDWRVNADCSPGGGGWNAMDGDLDIAMALLMADKQWGSNGSVDYKTEALNTIKAIKAFNMSADGFTKGLPSPANNRTSDYMITHFKAFKKATGDTFWDMASTKAFYLLDLMQARYAPATGLIPDFIINTGSANPAPSTGFIGDGNDKEGFYYWNACRLPWRLASDYVTTGDNRSRVVTTKLVDFFQKASGGNPALIQSGYKLDGSTGLGNFPSGSFIGPATAGAMVDAKFQPFLNSLWTYSSANLSKGYYDTELQLLSLIVASGNWWNP